MLISRRKSSCSSRPTPCFAAGVSAGAGYASRDYWREQCAALHKFQHPACNTQLVPCGPQNASLFEHLRLISACTTSDPSFPCDGCRNLRRLTPGALHALWKPSWENLSLVLDVSSKFLKPSTGVLRTRPECRQSLTYNMEYATCSMQHATYCMQHATYMGSLLWLRCSCWRALIRAHTRAVRLDELVDSDGKFRSAEIHATSAPGFLPSCIARRTHCTRQRWATLGGSERAVWIHGWDE